MRVCLRGGSAWLLLSSGGRTRRGFQRSATSVVLVASAAWIFLSKFSAPSGAALVCVFVRIKTGRGVLKCAGVCADAHRLRLLRRLPAPFFVGHAHQDAFFVSL